jgi:hypothetical protein
LTFRDSNSKENGKKKSRVFRDGSLEALRGRGSRACNALDQRVLAAKELQEPPEKAGTR